MSVFVFVFGCMVGFGWIRVWVYACVCGGVCVCVCVCASTLQVTAACFYYQDQFILLSCGNKLNLYR